MEEKQGLKISLSTFFLILAIITIIVMGFFIYKLNNDKTIEMEKSNELQSQVDSLSEDFIKSKFEMAWKIFESSYDIFQYDADNDSIELPVDGQDYTWRYNIITNFDSVIDKYISTSFNNLVDNLVLIISRNNNYYIMDSAEDNPLDKVNEIIIKDKSNDTISCIVKVQIASDTGLDDISSLERTYEFALTKENNDWKISKFNLVK